MWAGWLGDPCKPPGNTAWTQPKEVVLQTGRNGRIRDTEGPGAPREGWGVGVGEGGREEFEMGPDSAV